jgi:adenine-specific DNA-methyltransferase
MPSEAEFDPSNELAKFAMRNADLSLQSKSAKEQKDRSQYFTPEEVGLFMSSLFTINKSNIKILDAGAGVGLLSASFCQRILCSKSLVKRIGIDAYENDSSLSKFLKLTLEHCKQALVKKGIVLDYEIIEKDFADSEFRSSNNQGVYDYAILNPPYFRRLKCINIDSNKILKVPNIYAQFITISAQLLKVNGEMVFISPRSFCSGFQFRNFREWLLSILELDSIHIFEPRNHIFKKYAVLQENIIVKAHRFSSASTQKKIVITKSVTTDRLVNQEKLIVDANIILHKQNSNISIRIPTSKEELRILQLVDNWPKTFQDLGYVVSTGPVVPFRTSRFLQNNGFYKVPLIWMHNINKFNLIWPKVGFDKPSTISVSKDSSSILLTVRNFVLMKRISSKEQKKRLNCAVLLKANFPFEYVGIENHVNYIYKKDNELSAEECIGLCGLLNCSLLDKYFGVINGHNQVNASDIRTLPFPETKTIHEIGQKLSSLQLIDQLTIDNIVASVLK